ncbi:MAG: DNA polymerase III subunit [Clostridia bacterium]|nr:DNA polymerase III subunit [Clostridia bacterium]
MSRYFPSLVGNESTRDRLGRAIDSGRLPHALLIGGDRGSGKFTLALSVAAALVCENKGAGALPCGTCPACKKMLSRSHTDLTVLERDPKKATVGVSQIKELRPAMYLSPTEAPCKVYIIREADKMTPEAQNALLIILEEPPRDVYIILLATSLDRILTTIRSRAQYIPMQRFTRDELDTHLTGLSREARAMRSTSHASYSEILTAAGGSIGRALTLLSPKGAAECREEREGALSVINALGAGSSFADLHSALLSISGERAELSLEIECIINALRDMTALRQSAGAELLFFSSETEAKEALERVGGRRLLKLYELFLDTHERLSKNAAVGSLLTALAAKIKNI